jgi:hypothetical protein
MSAATGSPSNTQVSLVGMNKTFRGIMLVANVIILLVDPLVDTCFKRIVVNRPQSDWNEVKV